MKHPQREEWVPYLFGEAPAATQLRLSAHLEHCPECATEIAAWRRSIGRLDEWQLPARERAHRTLAPAARWALAASVVLGLGFALGWFAKPPGADFAGLRTELETSLKTALVSEVRAHLGAEVERVSAQAQERNAEALAALEGRLARTSDAGLRQVLQGLSATLKSSREEDRQVFATLLDQMQEQHAADYVSIRKDLETLATLTDDEMRQARARLNQLAARTVADNEN